jgi:hypothetical protein
MPGPWHASLHATRPGSGHQLHVGDLSFGCLTHNFNTLWCRAYNSRKELGLTHFAMMHSDIATQEGWLDILLAEMERTGADILSVVVAIKDTRGLTSMGVQQPGSWAVRRLTMREIYDLPETFSIDDVEPGSGKSLAINTGLWICRLRDDVWRNFPGFRVHNQMLYHPDSDTLETAFRPEDWEFAEWAHAYGLKVFATRKVQATHLGLITFPNHEKWGEWEFDREFVQIPASGSRRHLGGATRKTECTPNGDPPSWCPVVWDALVAEGARTVLDVGCGAGFAARYFESKGCECLGIEGEPNTIKGYQGSAVLQHDFSDGPAPLPEPEYDLAWSCELVEHVEEEYAPHVLATLARAKTIALTHAFPGQTGTHHVNCQEAPYWIERIQAMGYRHDTEATERLRALVNHGSSEGYHFARSGLIFRRCEA